MGALDQVVRAKAGRDRNGPPLQGRGRYGVAYHRLAAPFAGPGGCSVDELLDSRARHLRAVRTLFEQVGLLVLTRGLTEAWMSKADGAVYPDPDARAFCYADADLRKGEEPEAVFRFLDFWKKTHGHRPRTWCSTRA
jgi:hypothetical protein